MQNCQKGFLFYFAPDPFVFTHRSTEWNAPSKPNYQIPVLLSECADYEGLRESVPTSGSTSLSCRPHCHSMSGGKFSLQLLEFHLEWWVTVLPFLLPFFLVHHLPDIFSSPSCLSDCFHPLLLVSTSNTPVPPVPPVPSVCILYCNWSIQFNCEQCWEVCV